MSAQSVLFWKVTGCYIVILCLTSCRLSAKFSWIAASCSSIHQMFISGPGYLFRSICNCIASVLLKLYYHLVVIKRRLKLWTSCKVYIFLHKITCCIIDKHIDKSIGIDKILPISIPTDDNKHGDGGVRSLSTSPPHCQRENSHTSTIVQTSSSCLVFSVEPVASSSVWSRIRFWVWSRDYSCSISGSWRPNELHTSWRVADRDAD